MTNLSSPVNTYKDSGAGSTLKRNVNESFLLMSPSKFPELSLFGGGNDETPPLNTLDMSESQMTSDMIEWYEDELRPIVFTLNADINNSVTAFVTNPASDAAHLLADMIILMESEQMLVTANGNGTTGSVTVTRAYNGTAAAAHTAANVATAGGVKLITRAHSEGTDAPSDPWSSPTRFYNYWQNFMEEIKISDAEKGMARYTLDPGGYLERLRMKKYKEIYKQMTLSFYRGTRIAGTDTTKAQTGGIEQFILGALIQDKAAAALTVAHVNTLMQTIYDYAGGDQCANTIICSSANKVKLTGLFANSLVQVQRSDSSGVGGLTIQTIATEFGNLDIVMSNWCPTDRIYFLNQDMIHIGPLAENEMRIKALATSGDYEREVVTGNYAWQVMGSKCHGIIKNFT